MSLSDTPEFHQGPVISWLESLNPDQSGQGKHCQANSETSNPTAVPSMTSSSGSENLSEADAVRAYLLKKDDYRAMNLSALGIRFKLPGDKTPSPDWVASLVARVREARPDEEARSEELKTRHSLGYQTFFSGWAVGSWTVWEFFQYLEFRPSSYPCLYDFEQPPLKYDVGVEFKQHTIPHNTTRCWIQIATPKPDLAFGYETSISVFPQLAASEQLWRLKDSFYINSTPLLFPYLVWNGKTRDIPDSWYSVNKCLGDSAACIHTNERVIKKNNAVFSITTDLNLISFYVMWKENGEYIMNGFETCNLQNFDGYMKCGRILLNIHDWAKGERLAAIAKSLDEWENPSSIK
ncbi:hypothetical protein F4821DRAFT_275527 [Hypoxylon rubiginosum]|uniref:Uncharacterized protein n=1 Tax=Hypoxylon rubiginosum TaxID=110542 RepID=A0ACC0DAW1_9PEZI|nr:hypothetical protein F4821DRAFT_275527 [Hypoxylon rubiginosum]